MLAEWLGLEKGKDGMTRLFALRLLERVVMTFLFTAAGTYISDILDLGKGVPQLAALTDLSLGHKALVAGLAAVVQLVASTLVAPHIGDSNSPDLLPSGVLKKLGILEKSPAATGLYKALESQHPGLLLDVETLARRVASQYVQEQQHTEAAPPKGG